MRYLYRFKQIILALGELLCFSFGFWLSLLVRNLTLPRLDTFTSHLDIFFFLFLIWLLINYVNGLYDLRILDKNIRYRRILESAFFSLAIGILFFYLLPEAKITPKTILILNVIFGYSLAVLWRGLYNKIIGDKKLSTNVLFLGYNTETAELIHILSKEKKLGYKVEAVLDLENNPLQAEEPVTIYRDISSLQTIIKQHKINTVVTTSTISEKPAATKELYQLLFLPVQMVDLMSFYESVTGRIPPSAFSESWLLENLKSNDLPVYDKVKRGLDVLAAFVFALLLLISLPLIAPLTKLNSPGAIFFRQKRVGKRGKIFWIYKYRTMYVLSEDGSHSAEINGVEFAQKDDKRITGIGKFLRKTRLDELPQALNLLKGDITLIGPRPERPEIIDMIEAKLPTFLCRHIVKPGLTGWAAIHQNYADTREEYVTKLQYDLYYIKNRSFLLDLSVLLKTINVVLRGMGQ